MSSNWSSGTNVIKEVDQNKSLTLQMVRLKKQGGGSELFVRKADVALGTKSVTQNGTYTAASDGKYGFSQFSVNVAGGSGSVDSHGKPTGGDIKPGGAGSAVVGTDPDTGNEQVVGVDEGGNLVTTPLPSSIVLVHEPTKMSYQDGETIDLSGAVVTAKMADGTTWTDADHPNGHVSCTPDPGAADAGQVKEWSADPSWVIDSAGTYLGFVNDRQFYKANDGPAVAWFQYASNGIGWVGPIIASPDAVAVVTNYAGYRSTMEYGGIIWYINNNYHYHNTQNFGTHLHAVDTSTENDWYEILEMVMEMAQVTVSGTGGTQTITLNWARPGDGKVLSTTMGISVSEHTTESSSGTGGSGGGGAF